MLVLPKGAMPLTLPAGTMPLVSLVRPAFGIRLTFYMLTEASIRRPDDMLFSSSRPYKIVKVGPTGSQALNKLDRTLVHRMWNAMHLKRYYQ